LDDVRPFNYHQKDPIPIIASPDALATIRSTFGYIFDDKPQESSRPKIEARELPAVPFNLFGIEVTPVRLAHGSGTAWGFKFGQRAAYLTDHSDIPEESVPKLQDLEVLFLDALRHKPHPTHTTVARSVEWVERLKPKRAFFTHICHDLPHERTESMLPFNVRLAFDGLQITVGDGD
jgi:phosphoribosyl 1,2-cyclic phosphate phosphodiesterase